MQNRTRNKQLNLKFTEEEFEYFKKSKELSTEKNYTDFIIKLISQARIFTVDTRPILEVVNQINKIGVNINQIAKIANTTGNIYDNDIKELQKFIKEIQDLLQMNLYVFNYARKGNL